MSIHASVYLPTDTISSHSIPLPLSLSHSHSLTLSHTNPPPRRIPLLIYPSTPYPTISLSVCLSMYICLPTLIIPSLTLSHSLSPFLTLSNLSIYLPVFCLYMYHSSYSYGVATISRIDKIIDLFCRISALL